MSEPTKVKTTDDGVDIYVDPETGSFIAVIGECKCGEQALPRVIDHHSYYCKAKTVSRKSMADLERELKKAGAPKTPLKTINTESYYKPDIIEITGVEKDHSGSTRYRGTSGYLVSGYHALYAYTEEDWRQVQETWAEYQAASQKWRDLGSALTKVTRENFKQLLAQQQAQEQPRP